MSINSKQVNSHINPNYRFHPTQLSGKARAEHVVQALKTYNAEIIRTNPKGSNAKFLKLGTSVFSFMRGTADLMYRDFYGTDANKPVVLSTGDVHVENYAIMDADDGGLVWGLNDFDEANFAPFSWDVKRATISVILAATDKATGNKVFSEKKTKKAAEAFVKAYLTTIQRAVKRVPKSDVLAEKDMPAKLRQLLKKTAQIDAQAWMKKKYLDAATKTPQFIESDELKHVQLSERQQEEIPKALKEYIKSLKMLNKPIPEKIEILDFCRKLGSGTASIGLNRFYALVKLKQAKKETCIILEIKEEKGSVLDPYVDEGPLLFQSEGERVAFAENLLLPNANPYYGYTHIEQLSYLVRQRSPHKKRIDLAKLTKAKHFAYHCAACGKSLALAHLQSRNILQSVYPNLAQAILNAINQKTYVKDMVDFAQHYTSVLEQDWQYYKIALNSGVFTFNIHGEEPA